MSVLFAIVLICTLFAGCKDQTQCSEYAWQDWNTLKNAVISDKSYGYTVTENNITYAKEQFNYMFEDLSDYMSKYE